MEAIRAQSLAEASAGAQQDGTSVVQPTDAAEPQTPLMPSCASLLVQLELGLLIHDKRTEDAIKQLHAHLQRLVQSSPKRPGTTLRFSKLDLRLTLTLAQVSNTRFLPLCF